MLILLMVAVVLVLMTLSYKDWFDTERQDLRADVFSARLVRSVLIAIPLGFALSIVQDSIVIVKPGNRAVVFDKFKGVRPVVLDEGLNFVVPIIQETILYDVRIQKVEFDATAASKDLQSVRTKVALNFRPGSALVNELHQKVGPGYAERIIHPAVQEAVKAATARFTAEELITRREEVKRNIQDFLRAQILSAQVPVEILEIYITDFEFSREFASAVEAKQIAEQQAFKAKRDLDRIRIEAEQKIATARAEAQSLTLQREAITPNLIELRRIEAQRLAIEKWNGALPQMMLGNSTPMIDLGQLSRKSGQ